MTPDGEGPEGALDFAAMKRRCDRCEREATVHETLIVNGKQVEKHLCEACAREEGIAIPAPPSINDVIKQFIVSQAAATPPPGGQPAAGATAPGAPAGTARAPACASCGLTFAEFRHSGLLGCPECYRVFESMLGPLLERAHEGGTHHVGKAPRRAADATDRGRSIAALRKQLQDAIAAEQYERAAKLRDQLLRVEESGS